MSTSKSGFRKTIVCVLIAVLLFCVGIVGIFLLRKNTVQSGIAMIYQDGTLLETINLNSVTKGYTLRVDSDHGAYNIIDIQPGKIGIIEASCPDQICVHTGYISSSVSPITCLPNHLIIQIQGSYDKNAPLTNEIPDGISR